MLTVRKVMWRIILIARLQVKSLRPAALHGTIALS